MTRSAAVPPLHVVTTDDVLAGPTFVHAAIDVLRAGGEELALHLRGHAINGRTMFEMAAALVPVARECGAVLLVNDRVDVALASGAAGVQLGWRSMPIVDARHLLGPQSLIGASVHAQNEAEAAAENGADFLVVGTLFASRSHPGSPGAAPGILSAMSGLGVSLVGIGGITPDRVPEVLRAGGLGVAATSGIWGAPEPADAVAVYLQQIRRCHEYTQ